MGQWTPPPARRRRDLFLTVVSFDHNVKEYETLDDVEIPQTNPRIPFHEKITIIVMRNDAMNLINIINIFKKMSGKLMFFFITNAL